MRPAPTIPTRSLDSGIAISADIVPHLCRKMREREKIAAPLCRPFATLRLRLRLQHVVERLARIGELGRIERHAALDQPARRSNVALRVDAHRIGEVGTVKLELDHRLGTELAAHALAWLRQRPTHALDVEIVLLRPERWRHAVGHIAAGSIESGDRAMLLCMPPILKPYRPVRA